MEKLDTPNQPQPKTDWHKVYEENLAKVNALWDGMEAEIREREATRVAQPTVTPTPTESNHS
jgi:hypothetical protein